MEKQEYILNLSLQQLALRKLAIVLWNQADILSLIKSFDYRTYYVSGLFQWQNSIENVVKVKVARLSLADLLKEELMNVVKPIGLEILKWRIHHDTVTSDTKSHWPPIPKELNCLDQLRWTSVGTIDYRKTAEMLIRQEKIDLPSSYILACVNCLEDDIRIIWEKLSEDSKKLFYDEVDYTRIRQPELVIFWTYLIKGDVSALDGLVDCFTAVRKLSLYQYAFQYSSRGGNKAATEYFLQKLTFEERLSFVTETARNVVVTHADFPFISKGGDIVCFLFTQMNKEEQLEVLKKFPLETLTCLLNWPWQDIFMKVTEVIMWNFFPMEKYYILLVILAHNETRLSGCNYLKLFAHLILQAPIAFRNYIIERDSEVGGVFCHLFDTNNMELLKLVLRNVDDKHRLKFIMCRRTVRRCWTFVKEGNLSWLKFLVSECRVSNTNKKKILQNNILEYNSFVCKKKNCKFTNRKVYCRVMDAKFKNKLKICFKSIYTANSNNDNKRIIEDADNDKQL